MTKQPATSRNSQAATSTGQSTPDREQRAALSKSERTMMAKARKACGPFAGTNRFKAAV